jgi:hypothetical protein
MKPRHAAALALVGWYLMVPPLRHGKPTGADAVGPEAPLSVWQNMGSFDTAADCYKDLHSIRIRHEAGKDLQGDNLPADLKAEFLALDSDALCIATDDPRLKGK